MNIFKKLQSKVTNFAYAGLAALPNPAAPSGIEGKAINLTEIQSIIQTVAKFMIVVSMVVAVIFIVWGGLRYMMAQGDEKKAATAKSQIIHGLIGAGVILAVGVLLQTVAGVVTRSFFS